MLGEHCSDRERRAEAAERELTKVKLLNYLATRIGEEMDGVVTGVEEFGLFVQGIQLPAEGLVHVASLQDDYYRFERASHTLTGHRAGNSFRLGDQGARGRGPRRRRSPRAGFADRFARGEANDNRPRMARRRGETTRRPLGKSKATRKRQRKTKAKRNARRESKIVRGLAVRRSD